MTFESALQRVTGHPARLRSKAAPAGGWLTSVAPGSGSWWNYYPYGEMIFSVDRDDAAIAAWNRTLQDLDQVMPQIARGRYRLMQVPMLREAGSRLRAYGDVVGSGAGQARLTAGPVMERAGIEGTAATGLSTRVQALATRLEDKHDEMTTGTPTVGTALADAADALASFGQKMSEAWWSARPALGSTVTDDIDGLFADIVAFLGRHDLATSEGVLISYQTDDPVGDSNRVRELFGTYLPQGQRPSGMRGGFGSPADPAFWSSASSGITGGLTKAIQQLDDAADRALGELRDAYQRAVRAMGGTLTPEPADAEPVSATPAGTPLRRRLGTPLTPMTAMTSALGSPLLPAGRRMTPVAESPPADL